MKKMLKTMVSAICAVTMLAGSSIAVSAEVIAKFDNNDVNELSGKDYIKIKSTESLYYNTKATRDDLYAYVNTQTDEFKQFLKDAENRNDLILSNSTLVTPEEIGDNLKLIVVHPIFRDDEEDSILVSDNDIKIFAGYDDNRNPITSMFDMAVMEKPYDPVKLVQPDDIAYSTILACSRSEYVGVYNGRLIMAYAHTALVKFDDNGEPELVTFEPVPEIRDFYKTTDIATGEEVLVKIPNYFAMPSKIAIKEIETTKYEGGLVSGRFEPTEEFSAGKTVIPNPNAHDGDNIRIFYKYKGDVTFDGSVDIKDVSQYARHIVQLSEIPDYANVISDIDGNGSTDIKDLTALKSYLIGEKDSL